MSNVLFSSWGSSITGSPDEDATPVAADSIKISEQFDDSRNVKAFMGWDGIIVRDKSVNLVDMCREYMKKTQQESCGQCTPCRVGTRLMLSILVRLCDGKSREGDLETLESLACRVRDGAKCDIGKTTPIPILHALKHYRTQFEEAAGGKKTVKGAYLAKTTAPCTNACPSHLDVPGYVENIKFGHFDEALKIIRNDCCLPGTVGRVCVRPCEFNCRRGLLDDSISIKYLKRFCADTELGYGHEPGFPDFPKREEKVAIVGAGPAGLACAYYLGLRGYRCTIFESLPEPGGMAAVGIPDYRLPRPILRREAEFVEMLGSEIKYNMHVGKDITLDEIKEQGYKAIFLGSGSHDASSMRCEGEDAGYDGFMSGVEFLRRIALGEKPLKGKKIVAVGGGNVAIDCVRSALRLGFTDVNLVYRRTENEMPADPVEIIDAKEENITFNFLTQPVKVLARDNKVIGLECIKMELGEPDESGRRRPVPIEGSNFVIDADAMVPAIGQVTVLDYITDESGIQKTRWNTVSVDELTFKAEGLPVFSGGDCVSGPKTLIAALAAGKNAARHIARYLTFGEAIPEDSDLIENAIQQLGVYNKDEKMHIVGNRKRVHLEMLDPEIRIHSFDEVEKGMSTQEALNEASRCLRCYRIGLVAI